MEDEGLDRTQSDSEDGLNRSGRDAERSFDKSDKSEKTGGEDKSSVQEKVKTVRKDVENLSDHKDKQPDILEILEQKEAEKMQTSKSIEALASKSEDEPTSDNKRLVTNELIKYQIRKDPMVERSYNEVIDELKSKMKESGTSGELKKDSTEQRTKKQKTQDQKVKDKKPVKVEDKGSNEDKEKKRRPPSKEEVNKADVELKKSKVKADGKEKKEVDLSKRKVPIKELEARKGAKEPTDLPEDKKRIRESSDEDKKGDEEERRKKRGRSKDKSSDSKDGKTQTKPKTVRKQHDDPKNKVTSLYQQPATGNCVGAVRRDEEETNVSLRSRRTPKAKTAKRSVEKETVKDTSGKVGRRSIYNKVHSLYNQLVGKEDVKDHKEIKESKERGSAEPAKHKDPVAYPIESKPSVPKVVEGEQEALELYNKVPRCRVPLDIAIKKEFTLSFPPGRPREVCVYKTMQVVNLPEHHEGSVQPEEDVDQLDLGDWICCVNDVVIKDKAHYFSVVMELEKQPFPMDIKYTVLRTIRKKIITQEQAATMVSTAFEFTPGFIYLLGFLTLYPMSSLGINIKAYQGRVYISSTDNGFKSLGKRTFLVGDIIMSIDNVEVSSVKDAKDLIKKGLNSKERYCKVAIERPQSSIALSRVKLALMADKTVEQDPRLMDDVIAICDVEKDVILRTNPQAGPPIYHPRGERDTSKGISLHSEAKEVPIQCDSVNPKLLQHAPPQPGPQAKKRKRPPGLPRPISGTIS
ncbi:unnamed protein product [Bursaphelenchus xylophilus]|uniref:(pine wood nematode) hypothetical protein n=1 Tax=Bursaphelenchus xylophilus TaxID=6326 RepID=A0A1I7SWV6_BURXY|nr:unnamed protein product [Bursaphelenchus xylophilus]CAG9099980.1 unnamed protein product [Bursaphelenchus xylophilus]